MMTVLIRLQGTQMFMALEIVTPRAKLYWDDWSMVPFQRALRFLQKAEDLGNKPALRQRWTGAFPQPNDPTPDLTELYDGYKYLEKLKAFRDEVGQKIEEGGGELRLRLPDSHVPCHKLRFDAESVCWGEPWPSVCERIN
jgi:hypothetical protein